MADDPVSKRRPLTEEEIAARRRIAEDVYAVGGIAWRSR